MQPRRRNKLGSLRPSPSMAVAVTALFVSLGGVSYGLATGSIGSGEIRNDSIRSVDVRNRGLTGNDFKNRSFEGVKIKRDRVGGNAVKEEGLDAAKLAKVPRAAAADSAQTAATAATAGTAAQADLAKALVGVQIVPVEHRSGDVVDATVVEAGGLRLRVTCAASNEELRATTTVAGGEIAAISDDAIASDDNVTAADQLVHNLDDDFGPGDDFDLQDTPTASDDRIYQLHYVGGDGRSVTAHIITDDNVGTTNCVVSGYAVVT